MIFWTSTIVVSLVFLAGLVLLGTWLLHLPSAISNCDMISTMGAAAGGNHSLSTLGRCKEHAFPALDGVLLRGTYVSRHTAGRRGIVVFCHEFGGDRHGAVPYVAKLLDQGFDVFSFDFRNHGTSDRMEGYAPRCWATRHEVADVLGALNHVQSLDDADDAGVALMGLSRGACAAISAASGHSGVWAVIADGAFESRWVTTLHIRRFMPQFVRLAPVLTIAPWFCHVLYGTFVHNIAARKVNHPCIKLKDDIRRLRQPLLMIHGERDRTIPVELAQRLSKRVRHSGRLWIVPKGGHNRSLQSDPTQYLAQVSSFLGKHAPQTSEPGIPDASAAALTTVISPPRFIKRRKTTACA